MSSITVSIEQVHPNSDHVIVAAYVKTSTLYEKPMPLIGTTLDAFPQVITASATAYKKYTFSGAQETGRGADATDTKLMFIPPSDPAVGELNRVFSREFERDPITHDLWDVKRRISVSPSTTESPAGEVSTSVQMPNGLWVNTTRTIALPGRVQTTLRQTEEFGLITMTQQYVNTATGVAGVSALGTQTEAQYKPVNADFGLLTVASFTAPVSRTDIEFDPETWCRITVVRALSVTQATTQAAGTEVNSKQISAGLYLNVTRTIDNTCIGTSYSLRNYVPFTVPRILTAISYAVGTDGLSLTLNPTFRGGYEKQIQGTVTVDFSDSAPSPSTLYQIIPKRIQYNGTYFDIPFGDMITDAWTNVGSSGGTFVELVSWTASTPTATAYIADIGTSKLWVERTTRWRFQKFRRERQYIILE